MIVVLANIPKNTLIIRCEECREYVQYQREDIKSIEHKTMPRYKKQIIICPKCETQNDLSDWEN
jgi:hypothetical protein